LPAVEVVVKSWEAGRDAEDLNPPPVGLLSADVCLVNNPRQYRDRKLVLERLVLLGCIQPRLDLRREILWRLLALNCQPSR
jgi:hypothetical protein